MVHKGLNIATFAKKKNSKAIIRSLEKNHCIVQGLWLFIHVKRVLNEPDIYSHFVHIL